MALETSSVVDEIAGSLNISVIHNPHTNNYSSVEASEAKKLKHTVKLLRQRRPHKSVEIRSM